MVNIVFVHNYGESDFVDSCAEEQVCLKSKEGIPMTTDNAIFFAGDWRITDEKEKFDEAKRISFRRGGKIPTLKVFENEAEMRMFIENTSKEKPVISNTEVISFGKLKGQRWDDVLQEDVFDSTFWTISVRTAKDIPDDRKIQIYALLEKKMAEKAEKDGNNS